jgi:hypothetical protein
VHAAPARMVARRPCLTVRTKSRTWRGHWRVERAMRPWSRHGRGYAATLTGPTPSLHQLPAEINGPHHSRQPAHCGPSLAAARDFGSYCAGTLGPRERTQWTRTVEKKPEGPALNSHSRVGPL